MSVDRAEQLRELHGQHAGALWAYTLRLTAGDRATAEDVVQETLLRAWRTAGVLDAPEPQRRAWLFTVARRIVIDRWRSGRSQHEVTAADVPEQPTGDDTDVVLQAWLVAEALQRLSPDHRRVLVECYYRGCSVADAARSLSVPPGTVKSRTHYALKALRVVLEEMGVTS